MAWYHDLPSTQAIAVKGGIKARSKRGAFTSNWWGQRWLNVLESLNLGGRLARARTYARKGQVLKLDVRRGSVSATVQGSQLQPYVISIGVKPLAQKETGRLAAEVAGSPYFLAKLMTREMPQDIERAFEAAQVSLFPARASELQTECSCPDWSNPCKHIAAVYYLLAEEFDRDPFLIFHVRGIELDALLGSAVVAAEDLDDEQPEAVQIVKRGAVPPESFWEGTRADVDLAVIEAPAQPAPLLRRLGNLPFWRGERPLLEQLEKAYSNAAAVALTRLSSS